MLTTFDQAKKLKELGFDGITWVSYSGCGKTIPSSREDIPAPSVPEALQWIRDTFKITCTVEIDWDDSIEGYCGVYCTKRGLRWLSFCSTYPEAESELLTQILEYLEKKED